MLNRQVYKPQSFTGIITAIKLPQHSTPVLDKNSQYLLANILKIKNCSFLALKFIPEKTDIDYNIN
jgi:hypothetical protein